MFFAQLPIGENPDALRPAFAPILAFGLGVVEAVLQGERLVEVGAGTLENAGEVASAILAELGDGEGEVVAGRPHRVVGAHQGDAGIRPPRKRSRRVAAGTAGEKNDAGDRQRDEGDHHGSAGSAEDRHDVGGHRHRF